MGHVQKRMGRALRKYKKDMKGRELADGKGVAGVGRLTDKVINRIQNYYGNATRENSGNLQGMKESIKAIQGHRIVDDGMSLEKQHRHCPKGKDTWCTFWADKHNKTNTYDDSKRLPAVFMKELDPVFTRLSDNALLSRCLQGSLKTRIKESILNCGPGVPKLPLLEFVKFELFLMKLWLCLTLG